MNGDVLVEYSASFGREDMVNRPPYSSASEATVLSPPPQRELAQDRWVVAQLREMKQRISVRAPLPLGMFGSRCPAGAFGVLMYHRIAPRPCGVAVPTHSVTPARFRAQMEGLLARGFEPWSLRRVLDEHAAGRTIPAKSFVVTFDDGYENNYTYAWPVLRQLNIPATIFVATAYLDSDGPFPFDDWAAAGTAEVAGLWRPLSTGQCHEMLASGLIEVGAHTHTHADFRGRADAFAADLRLSLDVLRERFAVQQPTFAFPYGCRSFAVPDGADTAAARYVELRRQAVELKRAGVRCALASESKLVTPESDAYDWGRFEAGQADTVETLVAKLNGWYSLTRAAWRRCRRPFAGGDWN